MKIVITNGRHDDNKGDCIITLSAIGLLKQYLPVLSPKTFGIMTMFKLRELAKKTTYQKIFTIC